MDKDRLTFTLMDMGYKKAGPVQIYDKRTCYEDGNIIPFSVQLAIVTHALMLQGKRHGDIYQTKSAELVEAWTTSLDTAKTKLDSSIVSEPSALQYSLFQDVFQAPFPGPENPKFTFIDLFAGIGGFRMDVIDLIGKVPDERITGNGPKLHEYLQEMNKAALEGKNLLTVGETWGATPEIAKLYSSPNRKELSMVFQFEVISLDKQEGKSRWDLAPLDFIKFKETFKKWQVELYEEGWNSLFGNNHDLPRMVSRWGNDKEFRVESAKMLATMLHMQKGTPYIYQGEEIGMTNIRLNSIKDYNDIETLNVYKARRALGYSEQDVMNSIYAKSRDNGRTPMQ